MYIYCTLIICIYLFLRNKQTDKHGFENGSHGFLVKLFCNNVPLFGTDN